ncbi:hypothetical protein [Chryseolinea lacunae]|uniref:Tetratricopeptide repeat protein n=1 Tax=Chryseolinea lacunae TaxID=2801331 RepID=A0ABS1KY79_9BACT|nr:hypothetical protein [Chryseolinea lacunae]MBL0744290.1 hypothetical protein [Chryseolinea lacunae]
MKKESFIKLLEHYPECSSEEAQEVLGLKDAFPYSQLLHALSARLSKDQGFSTQGTELQMAAVYAADRGVLKEVMTAGDVVVVKSGRLSSLISDAAATMTAAPVEVPEAEGETLADEVMHDLEILHQLKHNFEVLFIEGKEEKAKASEKTKPAKADDELPESFHRDPNKSKRERIIELARAMEEPPKTKRERIIELAKSLEAEAQREQAAPSEAEPRTPGKKKRDEGGEDIIEEIASTKEEIKPENDKQKEQLQMIEQFIKTQPSITSNKDKPVHAASGDLSTIKTGEFNDNVVSETLVDILLKQGKKDKAIEVLKKLIWKFPQKKAYFAAQIEELKN